MGTGVIISKPAQIMAQYLGHECRRSNKAHDFKSEKKIEGFGKMELDKKSGKTSISISACLNSLRELKTRFQIFIPIFYTLKVQENVDSTTPPGREKTRRKATSAELLIGSVAMTSWESRSHADGGHSFVGVQISHTSCHGTTSEMVISTQLV